MVSQVHGQLRVAVIGTQLEGLAGSRPYTVYRTAVTYRGTTYERLLRYRDFQRFHKKMKVLVSSSMKAHFPKKEWTRKASLQPEVVEARQVLLNEFMRNVCLTPLSPDSEERLMKLLRIGKYDNGDQVALPLKDIAARSSERPTVDTFDENDRASSAAVGSRNSLPVTHTAVLVTSSITFPKRAASMQPATGERKLSAVLEASAHSDVDAALSIAAATPEAQSTGDANGGANAKLSSPVAASQRRAVNRAQSSPMHKQQQQQERTVRNSASLPADIDEAGSTTSSLSPEHKFLGEIEKSNSRIESMLLGSRRSLAINGAASSSA